ncbi:MAG: hypothetical protein GYB40_09425 [Vibrionaceae bacterium]|nr:hypothetical protein [Vibrionaceae bacterium]
MNYEKQNKKNSVGDTLIRIAMLLIALLLISHHVKFYLPVSIQVEPFPPIRIAHAGGQVNRLNYSNSYQALNENYLKGFRYFEIDLIFTSDHYLVCLHDWNNSFFRLSGKRSTTALSLEEFSQYFSATELTPCTLQGLMSWLESHPDAHIVTDVKSNNIRALAMIANLYPKFITRVIPQIYDPRNLADVREAGFDKVIWTLYRFSTSKREILYWMGRLSGPVAVTMPQQLAREGVGSMLKQYRVTTFTHTINSECKFKMFQKEYDIDEIYTDTLAPKRYYC